MNASMRNTKGSLLDTALARAVDATIALLTAVALGAPLALLLLGWAAGLLVY